MRQIWNTVEKTFPSFDKTKIYYEIQGSTKNKKIMLFLHGLGGNVTAWDPQRQYFARLGYTTIAMDLRGHGLSGRPRKKTAYTIENIAKDVLALIDLYQLKNIVLVGQCTGGMAAILLAGKFQVHLKTLILIGTGYKLPFYLSVMERSKAISFLYYALSKVPLRLGKPGQPFLAQFKGTETIDLRRFASDVFNTTARSYVGICSNLFSFNALKYLKKISCPTLIIHGTDDIIFPMESAKKLHRYIKNSQLVFIPEANHILVLNNPEEINMHIHAFLQEKRSPIQHSYDLI